MHHSLLSLPLFFLLHSTTAFPPAAPISTVTPSLYCPDSSFPLRYPSTYTSATEFCASAYNATCNQSGLVLPPLNATTVTTSATGTITSSTPLQFSTATSSASCIQPPRSPGSPPLPTKVCANAQAAAAQQEGSAQALWGMCKESCLCVNGAALQRVEAGTGTESEDALEAGSGAVGDAEVVPGSNVVTQEDGVNGTSVMDADLEAVAQGQ